MYRMWALFVQKGSQHNLCLTAEARNTLLQEWTSVVHFSGMRSPRDGEFIRQNFIFLDAKHYVMMRILVISKNQSLTRRTKSGGTLVVGYYQRRWGWLWRCILLDRPVLMLLTWVPGRTETAIESQKNQSHAVKSVFSICSARPGPAHEKLAQTVQVYVTMHWNREKGGAKREGKTNLRQKYITEIEFRSSLSCSYFWVRDGLGQVRVFPLDFGDWN